MNPFKLIIGLKHTYVGDAYIGSRLRAAVPNNQGVKFKPYTNNKREKSFYISQREVTSFKAPYLVAEGSDFQIITTKDVERFIQRLEGMGYSIFEFEKQVLDIARNQFAMAA